MDWGTNIIASFPAAAQRQAREEAAFPVEAQTILSIPNLMASATTNSEARSFKEPLGLSASFLINKLGKFRV